MLTERRTKTDFNLADYLQPRGKRPYEALVPDLEAAFNRGEVVYLWSVANHFVLSGSPELVKFGRAWSDGKAWYKTATDALNGVDGEVWS